MDLLSTAKSTILSGFSDLDTKFKYSHVENGPRDFQFLKKNCLFVEVNKKSGFEMLRVGGEQTEREIVRIRKSRVENLCCVACPKQGSDDLAFGLSTGQVRLLNYKNSDGPTKFSSEPSPNGVVFMDYNASDEFLASVFESGVINLYTVKSKIKKSSIDFDENSTLARFHPNKRFHLQVASHSGHVYVFDTQANRNVFKSLNCHKAPCRDVCTSPATPDIMHSVGYDCLMNVFDVRKKRPVQQIRCNHPLSAICVSDCGMYCCTGNLKGELTCYDLRNMKNSVASKVVHESAVVRVAFVPQNDEKAISVRESLGRKSLETESPKDDKLNKPRKDSFFEFLDRRSFRKRDTFGNTLPTNRDSLDLEAHERSKIDFPDEFCANINTEMNALSVESKFSDNIGMRRRKSERSLGTKFKLRLDDLISSDEGDESEKEKIFPTSNGNNEIDPTSQELNYFRKLPDDKNSTPNPCKQCSNVQHTGVVDVNKIFSQAIDDRFKQLESSVQYIVDCSRGDLFQQNFNLWKSQMIVAEETRDMLTAVLQSDTFVQEVVKLNEENQKLREENQQLREENRKLKMMFKR